MVSDVTIMFLRIFKVPAGPTQLILTAPSPYALLPTIVSRCLQFHFAPLPQAAVEKILKEETGRKPVDVRLAAQLAEGSPGLAIEIDRKSTRLNSSHGYISYAVFC